MHSKAGKRQAELQAALITSVPGHKETHPPTPFAMFLHSLPSPFHSSTSPIRKFSQERISYVLKLGAYMRYCAICLPGCFHGKHHYRFRDLYPFIQDPKHRSADG